MHMKVGDEIKIKLKNRQERARSDSRHDVCRLGRVC